MWSKTEPIRLWGYGVMAPLLALLAFKGVISSDEVALWLALGGAVLTPASVETIRSQTDSPATKAAQSAAKGTVTVNLASGSPTPQAVADALKTADFLHAGTELKPTTSLYELQPGEQVKPRDPPDVPSP
jgi:hypothetical protein